MFAAHPTHSDVQLAVTKHRTLKVDSWKLRIKYKKHKIKKKFIIIQTCEVQSLTLRFVDRHRPRRLDRELLSAKAEWQCVFFTGQDNARYEHLITNV